MVSVGQHSRLSATRSSSGTGSFRYESFSEPQFSQRSFSLSAFWVPISATRSADFDKLGDVHSVHEVVGGGPSYQDAEALNGAVNWTKLVAPVGGRPPL
jgi:hypothetical protein